VLSKLRPKKLYNDSEELEKLEREEEITPKELGPTVTKAEFEKALNEFKQKKAYGVDNIPAELLQALDEEIKLTLHCLINNIYMAGKIPDFKKSVMVMLPKKSKVKYEEYQFLSIFTHISKILTKIILGRIERKIEENLAEDQFGFQKNRGTHEAILCLRNIVEKSFTVNKRYILPL